MHQDQIFELERLSGANQDEWQGLLYADVLRQDQPSALPIIHKVLYACQICQKPCFRGKPQILVSLVGSACTVYQQLNQQCM